MSTELTNALLLGAGALLTAGGTVLINFIREKNKKDSEDRLQNNVQRKAEIEKAVEIYQSIVVELQSSMKTIKEEMKKLDEDHLRCREENASLRTEVLHMRNEIESLKQRLDKG